MGYKTREYESRSLTNRYPAYYKEMQVLNYSNVDVVITHHNGAQSTVPRWSHTATLTQKIVIAVREVTGMRSEETKLGPRDIPIHTSEYEVNYSDFISYPTKVEELGIVLSSVEHSTIAKDMVLASEYNPAASEYASDFGSTDPRLVFEVKDPYSYWEQLYLNVLGQTIVVRCGHRNQLIAGIDDIVQESTLRPTLTCYLRYPSNSVDTDNCTATAFTIDLTDIDKLTPFQLPSGDVLCVADSLESLQVVLSKKHNGHVVANVVRPTNMISKEVHEQLIKNLQDKIDRETKNNAEQLKALRIEQATKVAELNAKTADLEMENSSLKKQISHWSDLYKASSQTQEQRYKEAERREAYLAKMDDRKFKETEHTWDMIKIGAGALASLGTFALSMYLKSRK